MDDEDEDLLELAKGMEEEEARVIDEWRQDEREGDALEDDEEWVDEVAAMSETERREFQAEVKPVKMVVAKVRRDVLVGIQRRLTV